MATRATPGEIRVDIGGRAYTLVLNTRAMSLLEEHLSTPEHEITWDEIWTRVQRGSVRTIHALLWVMLRTHHPETTLDQAGALVDAAGGFERLTAIMERAARESTPDPDDIRALDVKPRPRRAQGGRRGTGVASISTRGASV